MIITVQLPWLSCGSAECHYSGWWNDSVNCTVMFSLCGAKIEAHSITISYRACGRVQYLLMHDSGWRTRLCRRLILVTISASCFQFSKSLQSWLSSSWWSPITQMHLGISTSPVFGILKHMYGATYQSTKPSFGTLEHRRWHHEFVREGVPLLITYPAITDSPHLSENL